MKRTAWQQRVVVDPEIHHGEPCIAGTRIPVRMIVGSLADGLQVEQIVAEYPQLSPEDVLAALAYAAEFLTHRSNGDEAKANETHNRCSLDNAVL
jgi:uncharacterized protein (DUF433 family)